MFVCAYDSPYAMVNIERKSILIEEIPREKMSPEYGVFAVSDSGRKELIMKHESYNFAKNLVIELHNELRGKIYNPSYVRRFNGSPDKAFFG